MKTSLPEQKTKNDTFEQRLDHYWRSIAVYSVVLILYSIFQGTITKGKITMVLLDPIVILLSVFVAGSAIVMFVIKYKKKTITVGKDYILLSTRFGRRKYSIDKILKITLGREKFVRINNFYRVIKFKIENRRRLLRIRPSSYNDAKRLVHEIIRFKKEHNK